jgi:hypothetical protein
MQHANWWRIVSSGGALAITVVVASEKENSNHRFSAGGLP